MIQKELITGSSAAHKIIPIQLDMRNCYWVHRNLTKIWTGFVISKENLKRLNEGLYCLISKFITGDETHIPFFNISSRQDGKV